MFSSKSSTVWAFTFGFLIHFQLIFVHSVKWGEQIPSFTYRYLVPMTFVEKIIIFPIEFLQYSFWNQMTINIRVYFCTVNLIPLIYIAIFMPVLHCLDYCSFVVIFEIKNCVSSNFDIFKDYFCYSESFGIPYEF